MSVDAMAWAYEQVDARPVERFLLVTMGDVTNVDGSCTANPEYLSGMTGLTVAEVQALLDGLVGRRRLGRDWASRGDELVERYWLPIPNAEQVEDTVA